MYVGQTTAKGVYSRCEVCGDSTKNPNSAHKLTDVNGRTYCFRCGASGIASAAALINVTLQAEGKQKKTFHAPPGRDVRKCLSRHTALTDWCVDQFDRAWFPKRNPQTGAIVSWHMKKDKQCKSQGAGLGFNGTLYSTPDNPLTLVEGPYDVLTSRYVCAFGTIKASHAAALAGHYVQLLPDGDVWYNEGMRKQFLRAMRAFGTLCLRVGVLGQDEDPDDFKDKEESIPWQTPQELNKLLCSPTRNFLDTLPL